MVRFRARGFTSTVLKLTTSGDGLTVWADCDDHPELWVELFIPVGELERFARLARQHQQAGDEEGPCGTVQGQESEAESDRA